MVSRVCWKSISHQGNGIGLGQQQMDSMPMLNGNHYSIVMNSSQVIWIQYYQNASLTFGGRQQQPCHELDPCLPPITDQMGSIQMFCTMSLSIALDPNDYIASNLPSTWRRSDPDYAKMQGNIDNIQVRQADKSGSISKYDMRVEVRMTHLGRGCGETDPLITSYANQGDVGLLAGME